MKQKSERSLGIHLANAQSLATFMEDFNNYKAPAEDYSLENLKQLVASTQRVNEAVSEKRQAFQLASLDRIDLYDKADDSIYKLLVSIRAAVKAQYGVNSNHDSLISSLVRNMKGKRSHKHVLPSADAATVEQKKTRIHRVRGSIAHSFSKIVTTVGSFLPAFNPANPAISMEGLILKSGQLVSVANRLGTGYANWVMARAARDQRYTQLRKCSIHIKEAVKAQYGINSNEFTLIKSLAI